MSDDLTRCPGQGCPRRNACLRFRKPAYGRIDAFGRTPWDAAAGECTSFWALPVPTDDQIRDRAYAHWQNEGCPEGLAELHWAAAEAEMRAALESELLPAVPDEV